jgi:hypothetical protein
VEVRVFSAAPFLLLKPAENIAICPFHALGS